MTDIILPVRMYRGDALLMLSEDKAKPLIEDMLYENDYIMLVGDPKTNKSILSMQMACALTTGNSFLGVFDVPEAVNVWYFATEGKDEDNKDRLVRMSNKVGIDSDRFTLFCSVSLTFNGPHSRQHIQAIYQENKEHLPSVIIIDSIYAGFVGSLTKDEDVIRFHRNIRWLAEQCGAAVILVHHLRKDQMDMRGNVVKKTDSATYGSVYFMGSVDHCFMITAWEPKDDEDKDKCKKDRYLRCDTQRSGHISSGIRLRLHEPDPLYLDIVSKHEHEKKELLSILSKKPNGMTVAEILKRFSGSRALFYIVIKELLGEHQVTKSGAKTKKYAPMNTCVPL